MPSSHPAWVIVAIPARIRIAAATAIRIFLLRFPFSVISLDPPES
jgi:hypothetical protein